LIRCFHYCHIFYAFAITLDIDAIDADTLIDIAMMPCCPSCYADIIDAIIIYDYLFTPFSLLPLVLIGHIAIDENRLTLIRLRHSCHWLIRH